MKFKIKKNSTYVIAEIGNNHEGSFYRAKKMIDLVAKTGANAVKFQTFKTDKFIKNNQKKNFLKKFEISYENFEKLKDYSHKNKLNFISTPLDIESAKFLGKICDAIKISSGDNNFLKLIEICLEFNKSLIISMGFLNHYETEKTINKIIKLFPFNKISKKISFLHCVSSYPVNYKNANLKRITYLKQRWPKLSFGYSDHTIGIEACLAAKMLGAEIIEKHFTLDKNFSNFRDHALSADVKDMKNIVSGIKKIEQMTSKYSKLLSNDENKNKKIVRRHPFAAKDLKIGEKIDLNNVKFLRPEKSLVPINPEFFIGRKLKKNISINSLIKKSDII